MPILVWFVIYCLIMTGVTATVATAHNSLAAKYNWLTTNVKYDILYKPENDVIRRKMELRGRLNKVDRIMSVCLVMSVLIPVISMLVIGIEYVVFGEV